MQILQFANTKPKKVFFKPKTCRVRYHKHLTCDVVTRNSSAQRPYFEDSETLKCDFNVRFFLRKLMPHAYSELYQVFTIN